MHVLIPVVGNVLQLTADLTIHLLNEAQNRRFVDDVLSQNGQLEKYVKTIKVGLKAGTELHVDRVYIRKAEGSAFDSITFRIEKNNPSGLPGGRFFVSVTQVNSMKAIILPFTKTHKPSLRRELVNEWKELSLHQRAYVNTGDLLENRLTEDRLIWSGSLCGVLDVWLDHLERMAINSLGLPFVEPVDVKALPPSIFAESEHGQVPLVRQDIETAMGLREVVDLLIPLCKAKVYAVGTDMVVKLIPPKDADGTSEHVLKFDKLVLAWRVLLEAHNVNEVVFPGFKFHRNEFKKRSFRDDGSRLGDRMKDSKIPLRRQKDPHETLILSDGFANNLFTGAEGDVDFFAYRSDDGERLSIMGFRRQLTQIKRASNKERKNPL